MEITVNGKEVAKYKKEYRLAGVAFHSEAGTDLTDVNRLQMSKLLDIRDEQQMLVISLDDTFRNEMKQGRAPTHYVLLFVPFGVTLDQFQTLRQAKNLGVREVGHVAGDP